MLKSRYCRVEIIQKSATCYNLPRLKRQNCFINWGKSITQGLKQLFLYHCVVGKMDSNHKKNVLFPPCYLKNPELIWESPLSSFQRISLLLSKEKYFCKSS